MAENVLFYGDNLDVMRQHVRDESVDLVYLDPPFNSNIDYNVLFAEHDRTRAQAQIKAFKDTWHWDAAAARAFDDFVVTGPQRASQAMQSFRSLLGENDMLAYLSMMAPRLVELRRVLKPTGSIYLHCDPTASHYLKLLMDSVFGPKSFRNEVVWKRHNARSAELRWPRIHDILLFYSIGRPSFKSELVEGEKARLPHTLITGPDGLKYQTYELTGAGTRTGETGRPWRGFDPTPMGRHWANLPGRMDEWDAAGLIHWPKGGGFPRRRAEKPFDEARQVVVGDVWTDIDRINQSAKERLGYPTQKPEALLERIIRTSSDEGDTVLDPFCGCGTAVAVAQRLNRRWVGVDITHLAVGLIKTRLHDAYGPSIAKAYKVVGEPVDVSGAQALAEQDRYQFQYWALGLVNARPIPADQKKGADKGIDGRLYFHDDAEGGKVKQVIFSVKSGKSEVAHVRDLRGVLEREKAQVGVLITMHEPTGPMKTEATTAGFYASPWGTKHPRLQVVTVGDLLAGSKLDLPPSRDDRTFKKAPRAKRDKPDRAMLPFDDGDD
jgi:site-specific DNA-methyltransferase (adenine-specific)